MRNFGDIKTFLCLLLVLNLNQVFLISVANAECDASNADVCVDPMGTPIPTNSDNLVKREKYVETGDNHKQNSCAYSIFINKPKTGFWPDAENIYARVSKEIQDETYKSQITELINDTSKKTCMNGPVKAITSAFYVGSDVPFYSSYLKDNFDKCGVYSSNPRSLTDKAINEFRMCIVQNIMGFDKGIYSKEKTKQEKKITKQSIEDSISQLTKYKETLNSNIKNYKAESNKLPLTSVVVCPANTLDKANQFFESMQAKTKDSGFIFIEDPFFSNNPPYSLQNYKDIGTNMASDVDSYGIHTYEKSCIHTRKIGSSSPHTVEFDDSSSFLSGFECEKIKNIYDNLAKNNDVKITSVLINASSSTGNNGVSKTANDLKDFAGNTYKKETYMKKDFNSLTTNRYLNVLKCLKNNDNFLSRFKNQVNSQSKAGIKTSIENFVEGRVSGENGNGTSGPCAYRCAKDTSADNKCIEEQNEEIKSYIARGDDLNSVSLDKNNTYNLYKSFQKVEVIFNYYSTAKSGDNTGNFKAVAAMKCYNINFSCGKK